MKKPKDKATQLKIEMLAMMQNGKTTSGALRDALNSEGWRLSSPDVCNALDVMKRWGWVKVAETKPLPAGKRSGERLTNIWVAKRDVPTVEEVEATRHRRRRRGAQKAKTPVKAPSIPAKKTQTSPRFRAYLAKNDKLMVSFDAFDVPAETAAGILRLMGKKT
jgi:hypothetical protein